MEPVSPMAQYMNTSAFSLSVTVVLESEIPINENKVMELLQNVFIPLNPRFSSIMVEEGISKEKQYWKNVEVKVEEHIRVPIFPSGLSVESYDKYLGEYLSEIALEIFPKYKPLWEVHLINYPTTNSAACFIIKFHHSIGDGFSLMGTVFSTMTRADNPSLPLTFPSRKTNHMKTSGNLNDFLWICGFFPLQIMSFVFKTLSDFTWNISSNVASLFLEDHKTPIRSGNDLVEFLPSTMTTMTFSLDRIKFIKNQLKVTINDVMMGVIFLGARLYMQEISPHSSKSRCSGMALLNTRMEGGNYTSATDMIKSNSKMPWGNRFHFLRVPIPMLTPHSNPLSFVWHARKVIQRQRSLLSTNLTSWPLRVIAKLRGNEAAAGFIGKRVRNSSMTVSNMIGPVEKMSLADHPIKGFYFLTTGMPQSLDIMILSYVGELRVGFRMEKELIDPDKFKSCMGNAFESIYKEALCYRVLP